MMTRAKSSATPFLVKLYELYEFYKLNELLNGFSRDRLSLNAERCRD